MKKLQFMFLFGCAAITNAAASTETGLPWEGTLATIERSLTGPVPRVIGAILVVIGGLTIALTEGQGWKKLVWVLVGIGIALNVPSLMSIFFNTAGGLVY